MRPSPLQPNRLLRHARMQCSWTQEFLAEQLGTHAFTVSRWERGEARPSPYFRQKLTALLGKSAAELGLVIPRPQMPDAPEGAAFGEEPPLLSGVPALWTVPYARNPYFTGREDLLEQVQQRLAPAASGEQATTRWTALTQSQAIKGLGGIGKTQIALEYAFRAREQGHYQHILWVNAASEEAILTSLALLADVLPGFPVPREPDQRKLVAAIKHWLEQCPDRWLMIFDNADDLPLVQAYLPGQGQGSILLTTRMHAVGFLAEPLAVETMGLVEGTQFLLARAQRLPASDEDVNAAMNVVIALDGFPLALDQAGAYMEETGCGFEDYLQAYQDHRQTLLARRSQLASPYPESVATTWTLSFETIQARNPAAVELLRLCAFLAPDRIPEELIQAGAAAWPSLLQQATMDRLAFDQMMEDLLRFSLIKRLRNEHLLSIHRLVQAVQQDHLEPEQQQQWAERVVRAVQQQFPPDPKEVRTWPQCLRYLEQAQACDRLIEQYQVQLPEAADLLDRTGTYLRQQAAYLQAILLLQRALAIRERLFGPEHPLVAASLEELAVLCRTQGKDAEAEALYQRALAIYASQVDSEDACFASALMGLANLYMDQGKYAEAEALYERALGISEAQEGPEHPSVARVLYNLANLSFYQGKAAEAEACYQRALQIWKQQVGPEHPHIAFALNGLANLYMDQGKYAEAEPHYQRALQIWKQQFSPEHPLVATALSNLALLYLELEQYALAEPLFQQALSLCEQVFGPEHRDVAHPLTGLARLSAAQGKYAEAERLYQRALTIREHTLEPHHPQLAETLHEFATLQEAQGNLQEASVLYHRALVIREQIFGADHAKTVETKTRYTELLQVRGMGREAEASLPARTDSA